MKAFIKEQLFKSYLRKGYNYFTITENGKISTVVLWKVGESNKTINIY